MHDTIVHCTMFITTVIGGTLFVRNVVDGLAHRVYQDQFELWWDSIEEVKRRYN